MPIAGRKLNLPKRALAYGQEPGAGGDVARAIIGRDLPLTDNAGLYTPCSKAQSAAPNIAKTPNPPNKAALNDVILNPFRMRRSSPCFAYSH